MFYKKRIEALEGKIATLEGKLQELESKLNEGATICSNKDKETITPAQILNEWLNGAKEG